MQRTSSEWQAVATVHVTSFRAGVWFFESLCFVHGTMVPPVYIFFVISYPLSSRFGAPFIIYYIEEFSRSKRLESSAFNILLSRSVELMILMDPTTDKIK